MKRTFVEFAAVTEVLKDASVSDESISVLHRGIMQDAGDIIPGTNGLRKIRCAIPGRGKSGGVRIIYADYPEAGICLLVVAFAKNVKENLSKAERNQLAKLKTALDSKMRTEIRRKGV